MGSSVLTNIAGIAANNSLNKTNLGLQKTLFRLSSGLRISTGADDAAGLSIADGLLGQIKALDQASRNANDGIGYLQVMDGALAQITNMLHRAVTLAEQSATGTVADSQRVPINIEFQEIKNEINRMFRSITYNGRVLLNSSGNGVTLGVFVGDTHNSSYVTFSTPPINSAILGLTDCTWDWNTRTFTSKGSIPNSANLDDVNMSTSAAAANALTALNHALNIISSQRARLGSVTNRLQATVEVVSNQFQNLTSAESQIRDANMATEVTALTKWQILNQTGIASLAQANQSAQLVTQLLQ